VFRPRQKRWGAEVVRLQTGNHGVDTVCKPAGRPAPPRCFVKSRPRHWKFAESSRVAFIPTAQNCAAHALSAETANRIIQGQLFR
jgi:hypothetical protein